MGSPEILPRSSSPMREECCHVCGAAQASWPMHSKPTNDKRPFFPFLQYQKPPQNARGIDRDGKVFVCNVCYAFLIQQWHSYEESNTPVLKRLYWLKRPGDEYKVHDEADYPMQQHPHGGHLIPASSMTAVNSDNFYNRALKTDPKPPSSRPPSAFSFRPIKEGSDRSHHMPQETLPQSAESQMYSVCFSCSRKFKMDNLHYVHTRAQLSPKIPYFPCLINEGTNGSGVDLSGRVLVCEGCRSSLYEQWSDFEFRNIPKVERRYDLVPPSNRLKNDSKVACFTCSDIVTKEPNYVISCKDNVNGPYYPFLKNLQAPFNSVPIDRRGITYSCDSCQSFLYKQWRVFEDSSVPQEERVYRPHPSQPPLLPTSIAVDKFVACFICAKGQLYKHLKRVYCNSGSNMNLGFLTNFQRNKDAIYVDDTGETFVCLACFDALRQHWFRYRKSLFSDEQYTQPTEKAVLACEICTVAIPGKETTKLNIFPAGAIGSQDEKPFFPFLSKLKKADPTGIDTNNIVTACTLCSANLIVQWDVYEQDKNINESVSKWDRKYRLDHFLCFMCGEATHRNNITLLDCHLVKEEYISDVNPCALKIKNMVVVCFQCEKRIKPSSTKVLHLLIVIII